jgi:predicted PurR-regulated permease PerM
MIAPIAHLAEEGPPTIESPPPAASDTRGHLQHLFSGQRPKAVLTLAALVVVIAGMRAAAEPLVTLMLAALLAVLSLPLVTFLQRHRVPMPIAVISAVAIDIAVLAGLGVLMTIAIEELTAAPDKYSAAIERLIARLAPFVARFGVDLQNVSLSDVFGGSTIAGFVGGTLSSAMSIFTTLVFVLLTMAFILSEATGFPLKLREAFGIPNASLIRFTRIMHEIQRYLWIKTAISMITALLFGAWLAFLGIDFAVLWSMTAFALNYVPNIGSVIALIPPTVIAGLQYGIGKAILVVIGNAAIYTVFGNILEPSLMGRRFGLSPLVIFLSVIFWGWIWGPVGMLLAVPLMMSVKISFENSEQHRWIAVLLDPSPAVRRRRSRRKMLPRGG